MTTTQCDLIRCVRWRLPMTMSLRKKQAAFYPQHCFSIDLLKKQSLFVFSQTWHRIRRHTKRQKSRYLFVYFNFIWKIFVRRVLLRLRFLGWPKGNFIIRMKNMPFSRPSSRDERVRECKRFQNPYFHYANERPYFWCVFQLIALTQWLTDYSIFRAKIDEFPFSPNFDAIFPKSYLLSHYKRTQITLQKVREKKRDFNTVTVKYWIHWIFFGSYLNVKLYGPKNSNQNSIYFNLNCTHEINMK